MAQVKGKTAFITGGSQGLGKAISEAYLDKGIKVCIADVAEESGLIITTEFQSKYGEENVFFVQCDVTNSNQFEDAILKAIHQFGHLDILVNNAGIGNEEIWDKIIEVNLIGVMRGTMLAFKHLSNANGEKGGYVLNTASIVGLGISTLAPAYCASKHGVVAWTKAWGHKSNVAKTNVKINAVCPSLIDTKMGRSVREFCIDEAAATEKYYLDGIMPSTSFMTPEFVAQAYIQLLEDDVTGAAMVVTKDDGCTYYKTEDNYL